PGRDFFALAPPVRFSIVLRVRFSLPREVAMSSAELESARLESLEVGAAPLVRHFLNRLALPELFARHLAALPGRQPALPTAVVLGVLLTNLLLARQPLYA